MAARSAFVIIACLICSACAAQAPSVKRIALIAPFDGTYREVGYDALYPVKLALDDVGVTDVQLLSIDDGGSISSAVTHAEALATDPTVKIALVAGAISTDSRVLEALGDLPVIVIGDWNATSSERVSVMASASIQLRLTAHETDVYSAAQMIDVVGGETFGLKAFAHLTDQPIDITILTSAAPPAPEFREMLLASDLFVPEPGLLATVSYDAGTLATRSVSVASSRADILAVVRGVGVEGINGAVRFGADGYWTDAPIFEYYYQAGFLTLRQN